MTFSLAFSFSPVTLGARIERQLNSHSLRTADMNYVYSYLGFRLRGSNAPVVPSVQHFGRKQRNASLIVAPPVWFMAFCRRIPPPPLLILVPPLPLAQQRNAHAFEPSPVITRESEHDLTWCQGSDNASARRSTGCRRSRGRIRQMKYVLEADQCESKLSQDTPQLCRTHRPHRPMPL